MASITNARLPQALEDFSLQARDDYFRRAAMAIYLCSGNKTEAYRFYTLNTQGKVPKHLASNSKNWFLSAGVRALLSVMEPDVEEKHFVSYCRKKGLSVSGIMEGASVNTGNNKAVNENDRTVLRAVLKQQYEEQYIKANENNDIQGAIAASKALAELMDAKAKQDLEEAEKTSITYFLPANVCENCDKRSEIESKYSDYEQVEKLSEELKENKTQDTVINEDDINNSENNGEDEDLDFNPLEML